MSERDDYEALYHEHLPFIDRVIASVTRVLGLRAGDADEFAWWAKERLWEGEYAILRKWRGESRLTTYLTTVVTNLGREFRTKRWGRWRASAAALRLGPLAVRLESLVYRDGMRLDEAAELLRTRGETTESDRTLAALLAQIPERARPRRAGEPEPSLDTIPDGAAADDGVLDAETSVERREAYRALDAAIVQLPPDERLVIRMHFLEGRSLADVARALGVPQKPLYRLKDRALDTLARALEAAGLTRAHVRSLLGGIDGPERGDSGESRPSNAAWAGNSDR